MATTRNVFGNIKDFTDADIQRGTVQIDYTGSYDSGSSYIQSTKYVKTDENGDFDIDLTVTEGLNKDSSYTITFPSGESFVFKLPLGDGDPINITTLRDMAALGVWFEDDVLIIDGGSPDDIADLIISGGTV